MLLGKKNFKLLLELLQLSFRSLLSLLFSKLDLLAVLSLSFCKLSCFIDSLSDLLNLLLTPFLISLDFCGFASCLFGCFGLSLLKNHLAMFFKFSGMLFSSALLILLALKFSLLASLFHCIVAFLTVLCQDLLPLFALICQELLLFDSCVVIDFTYSLLLFLVVLYSACNCLSLSLLEALRLLVGIDIFESMRVNLLDLFGVLIKVLLAFRAGLLALLSFFLFFLFFGFLITFTVTFFLLFLLLSVDFETLGKGLSLIFLGLRI